MSDPKRIQVLVETYAERRQSLAEQLLRALIGLWLPFKWWSRPEMMQAYAAKSATIVDGAVTSSRHLARAYAVEVLRETGALPDSLPPVEEMYPRSNVALNRVLERPARLRGWLEHLEQEQEKIGLEWDDLPDEDDLEDTLPEKPEPERPDGYTGPMALEEAFEERLREIIEDDLTAAGNDEAQRTFQAAPKVTGYRRIIHPELSKGGTCGLCVVAADRTYTIEDLMAIHDRCKCTVLPITTEVDPGYQLSREDLDALYEAAGSTSGKTLKEIRVKTELHGELGPRLVHAGRNWRSVDDVNDDSGRVIAEPWKRKTADDERAMWKSMQEHAQEMNERLADALMDGTNLIDIADTGDEVDIPNITKAMDYYRDLIAYARRRAA